MVPAQLTLTRTGSRTLTQVLACFSSTIFWFLVTTFSDPGILPRNTEVRARVRVRVGVRVRVSVIRVSVS